MPITCICPKCRQTLSIADQYAGQPMRCPFCSAMFQAPPAAAPVSAAAPAAAAPSVAAAAAQPKSNPFSDGAAAGYEGPTPPWQAPKKDPHAPEWPWLVGKRPPGTDAAYDWDTVQGREAMRLAPGWHMVLRGMALLPGSLILVFATAAITILFVQLTNPEQDARKIVLLIVIPIVIIGSLAGLVGKGLCCLVPPETRLRRWAAGAATSIGLGLMAGLMAAFLWFVSAQPGWVANNPGLGTVAQFVMMLSFVVSLILLMGGGAVFLLFMRGIARVFDNKRLATHLLWYLAFFAISPAFALMLLVLFRGTALVLGLKDQEASSAVNVVYTVAEFTLFAVVLAGFLLMLRDVRNTIERAILPSKTT